MEQKKKIKLSIIFVCTGNTCRSPMAEYMFKAFLKEKKRSGDFSVSSAGLVPEKGSLLSPNAHAALELLGIKHDPARKAKTFTVKMSLDGELIVAMSAAHAKRCNSPNAISFEQLIGAPIPDPYGGPLDEYMAAAAAICSAFERILSLADARLKVKRGE